jgi:uncharacterized protein (DUF2147 family)
VTSGAGVVPPLLRYVVMPLFSAIPFCEAKACPKTIAALALVAFNVALSTVIHVSSSGAAEAGQAVDDTLVKTSSRVPSSSKNITSPESNMACAKPCEVKISKERVIKGKIITVIPSRVTSVLL